MSKETGTPALIKMLSTLKEKLDFTYIAIIVLSVALYVGFDDLISGAASGTARDTISAALAAIFVLITTMYMLNKQTDIEQKKKLEEKIYINKFKIYDEVINVLQDIGYIEFKISDENFKKCLNKHFELLMVAPKEICTLSNSIQDYIADNYEKGKDNKLDEIIRNNIRDDLWEFTRLARKDLDISVDHMKKKTNKNKKDDNEKAEQNIIDNSGQKLDKFKFKGEIYNKRGLVLGIVKHTVNEQSVKTFKDLKELFPDEDSTSGIESKKKYNFIVALKSDFDEDDNRIFKKDDDIIILDNKEIIVHNQWGGANFDYFLKQVQKKLAYEFVEVDPEK
jgi:hypothetical protein